MTDETQDQAHPEPDLVRVFSTSQADVIPVIKSLLESAGIPFVSPGEGLTNLFPSDALGPMLHEPHGQVEFLVPAAHETTARAMLERFEGPIDDADPSQAPTGGDAG